MNQNLFHYATSELSQDAFICWLLSHGTNENKGTILYECAMTMLTEMCEHKCEPIEVKDIKRQYENIDVLVEVLADNKETYWFIIEDKTGTSVHDKQLERYIETVKTKKETAEDRIIGVYYKSGIQGVFSEVKNAGYHIMCRDKILCVLSKYVEDSKSEILKDYYDNLNTAKIEAKQYKALPYKDWDWPQIEAFFDSLMSDEEFMNRFVGFEYVANQNGGFIAMWNDGKKITGKSWIMYLQLEFKPHEAKICLKGTVDEDEIKNYKTEGRALLDMISLDGVYKFAPEFSRPKRLVSAHWMTLGVKGIDGAQTEMEIRKSIVTAIGDYEKCVQRILPTNM